MSFGWKLEYDLRKRVSLQNRVWRNLYLMNFLSFFFPASPNICPVLQQSRANKFHIAPLCHIGCAAFFINFFFLAAHNMNELILHTEKQTAFCALQHVDSDTVYLANVKMYLFLVRLQPYSADFGEISFCLEQKFFDQFVHIRWKILNNLAGRKVS